MTSTPWLSPVRILDSSLLGTAFAINSDYNASTPILTVTVGLENEHPEKRDDLNVGRCVFAFSGVWHEPDNSENVAYTIDCTMGITIAIPDSAFEEGFSKERKIRALNGNAVSLVYGKIRSFIEDLTSQSPIGRQIIPAIEPYALIQSLEDRNIESNYGGAKG
ncbi:MAG: hypothetical protein IKG18_08405 [Atopobiaceae bacterium]|nr:hypothetical protein [Atopobiaceae bacterium]MBR3314145.1 hypothetical protein [Atopobiaceae bacterium]